MGSLSGANLSETSVVPPVERHPFEPFLPKDCRLLMLGSFPPAEKRWSMRFYYPNFTNDMWCIMGLHFFGDKNHFVDVAGRHYRLEEIVAFLREKGIALYDTCTRIRRTTGTASDKDLEIIEPTDLDAMLRQLPQCTVVATAGKLATSIFASHYGTEAPKVGSYVEFTLDGRTLRHYRMPSSSRAYPMRIEKKTEQYQKIFSILD